VATGRRGGRGTQSRPRNRTQRVWSGLQVFAPQAVVVAGVALELIPVAFTAVHGPLTAILTLGDLNFMNTGSDAANGRVNVASKLAVVRVEDSGLISADWQALDTDIADISSRQLFHTLHTLGAEAAGDFQSIEARIRVEARSKVKVAGTKEALVMLIDATTANRAEFTCNLRTLCIAA